MKRCVLRWLLLLLAAGSLHAEQAPPTPASDAIFLWLAGGISSARIERLAQTRNESADKLANELTNSAPNLSCHATTQCTRALLKAGADAGLIQSLGHRSSDQNRNRKSAASVSCACSSPAAQIAALIHDAKFDAAEDRIRTMLRNDADDASPQSA